MTRLRTIVQPNVTCPGSRASYFICVAALLGAIGCAERPAVEKGPTTSGRSKNVAVVTNSTPANGPSQENEKVAAVTPSADEQALAIRYRDTKSYRDTAILTLTQVFEDGRIENAKTTIQTNFERPNRIRIRIESEDNAVVISSDGEQMTAHIIDPVTDDFHGQVVLRKAPEKLSIADLYQITELVDPVAPQEMVSALLAVPASLDVLPLSLLLAEGKLATLLGAETARTQLASQSLPTGELCQVIDADASEGTYRLWISDNALRRIELPPLQRDLYPGVKQLSLAIDIRDQAFRSDRNSFQIQEGGTQVRHFVLPPIPLVTDKLGQNIQPLEFYDPNLQPVRVANDEAQATVLVWFGNHPESRMALQAIEQVRKRNRSDRVRIAAVAFDDEGTPDVLNRWNVETAWLQDRKALGRDALGIEKSPTVIVLGPKNRLDYFEVGANPRIGADVAFVLERLLAGQNVATATLASRKELESNYKQILANAKRQGEAWVEELHVEVPAASLPNQLTLETRWKCTDIQEPGNFLVVPGKRKQILVVDGWKQVAMLDRDGKRSGTITLDLPENEGISFLRAGSNGKDRALFAAATRGGRQAFVFDFAGKRVTQYPPTASEPFVVSDLLVHAIRQDATPELIVSWQGKGGVHAVNLEGQQQWSNQATQGGLSLAAAVDADSANRLRPIVCSNDLGAIFLIDETGRTLREVRPQSAVHHLASWPGSARGYERILRRDVGLSGEQQAQYLGIASSTITGRLVSGINQQWQTIWTYAMPQGVYRHQIDLPQSFSIPSVGSTWIVPGPDGSIHFLSADGKFQDRMFVGDHLRGIAGTEIDDEPVLLIATDAKVTAYTVRSE